MTETEFVVLFGPQILLGTVAAIGILLAIYWPMPKPRHEAARRRSRYTPAARKVASSPHAGAAE